MGADPNAVKQIMEMGFTEEDAVGALQVSNGDVGTALNYMFQANDNPSLDYQDNNIVPLTDSINEPSSVQIEPGIIDHVRPPHDIPQTSPRHTGAPQLPQRGTTEAPYHVEDIDQYRSHESSDYDLKNNYYDQQYTYSVYDDIKKYKRNLNVPPVLMPVKGGLFESYLNPLITILHEIPALKKVIFSHEFENVGFDRNWFKGDTVDINHDVTNVQKDDKDYDLSFLLEVQRLFGFLEGSSERSFTSIKNFIRSFPKDKQQQFADIDNLREAYDIFYKALTDQLDHAGIPGSLQFFQHEAFDDSSSNKRHIGMFSVESEEIDRTLYHTIHSIVWGEEIDNSQTISELADIFAISIEPSAEDNFVPIGLEIPEEFYPQIYTTEFKPTIDKILEESGKLAEDRVVINKELLSLKAHNGKPVSSFLNSSIGFLGSEVEAALDDASELKAALDDLKSIKTDVDKRKAELTEKQQQIGDQRHKINPFNVDYIIESSSLNPEPYILTGYIFSPTTFVYLKKFKDDDTGSTINKWLHVEFQNTKDFRVTPLSFQEIKAAVHATTRSPQFESPMVAIYVKKSKYTEEVDYSVPKSVQEFLEKDNKELNNILELLSNSSDADIENSENDSYISVSDYEEQLIDLGDEEDEIDEDLESNKENVEAEDSQDV